MKQIRFAACPHGLRNRRVCADCWNALEIKAVIGEVSRDAQLSRYRTQSIPTLDSALHTIAPRHTKNLPITK